MTALNAYIRLESTGLWRAEPGAQRRDVYVFLGDASLVVADKSESALSHWSLPAIERQNPGKTPAIFMPGSDTSETLEIDDPEMISAIEKVQAAVHAADPKPGRLRLWAGLSMLAVLGGLAVFWLPDAVVAHAERVVPQTTRSELGNRVLTHAEKLAGDRCDGPAGKRVLDRLAQRLAPDTGLHLVIVGRWPNTTGHLPGNIILLDRELIDVHDTPDVLAGHTIAEFARAQQVSALSDLMRDVGTFHALRFLATGQISDTALQRHTDQMISRPRTNISSAALVAAFETARIPARPYANNSEESDQVKERLLSRDPYVAGIAPTILSDNDWVTLQSICEST